MAIPASVKEVVDDIPSTDVKRFFSGYNTIEIRRRIRHDLIAHWTDRELQDLSDLLLPSGRTIGGVRIAAFETESDRITRLLLLFYRVPGYHDAFKTLSLKRSVSSQPRKLEAVANHEIKVAVRYLEDLELWADETAKLHGGRLVHYYSQGEDKRLGDLDKTEDGWCLGMSVHWLGCQAKGEDFWASHLGEEGPRKYRFVMAAQEVRVASRSDKVIRDRGSFRLAKYNLKKESKKQIPGDKLGERMALEVTSAPHPFLLIGQYYVGGGGHAMAACLEGTSVQFLDPNLGELLFNSFAGFQDWYPCYLRRLDYLFKVYYVESYSLTRSVAVPPP